MKQIHKTVLCWVFAAATWCLGVNWAVGYDFSFSVQMMIGFGIGIAIYFAASWLWSKYKVIQDRDKMT